MTRTLGPPEEGSVDQLLSDLGGSEAGEQEAPPDQASETPPTEETAPQVTGQEEPQPAVEPQPQTLEAFMQQAGMDQASALKALQEYQYLNTEQGQQEYNQQIQGLFDEEMKKKGPDIFREHLGNLLKSQEGIEKLQGAIQAATAPAVPPPAFGEDDEVPEGMKQYLTAMSQQMSNMQRENRELREQLQQVSANTERHDNSFSVRRAGDALDHWMQANPTALRWQRELAEDIGSILQRNPNAFKSPADLSKAANYFLTRYQRISSSPTEGNDKPAVPTPNPRPRGGGGGPAPAKKSYASVDDAIGDVLQTIDELTST